MTVTAASKQIKRGGKLVQAERKPPDTPSPATGQFRVLIVEDDADVAQLISLLLEDLPARTDIARDGPAGLEAAGSGRYDLVALDLRLPRLGGLEICRRLRQQRVAVPILVVSARGSESDRIVGLELGADDYVVKPFNPGELLARARALLRRSAMHPAAQPGREELLVGEVRIDLRGHRVWISGCEIGMTVKEFDLLIMLAGNPGRVFGKAELLSAVWGSPYQGYEHTLTCHISRLRAKVEADPQNPRRILTVWGIGYKMVD